MNEKQRGILRALDRHSGRASASQIASDLWQAGLMPEAAKYTRDAGARGVANSLTALRKRGLVRSEGGGGFVSLAWILTDEGRAVLTELTA